MAQHPPQEVARYTVEQNGGSYTTTTVDLLALFGRQQLTDQARQEIRSALAGEGVSTEPDVLIIERSQDIRLFLTERQPTADAQRTTVISGASWLRRFRPTTWKGWTAYAIATLLIIGALTGDSEQPRDSRSAAATARQGVTATGLEAEGERLRRERVQDRHERARRERARARRAAARRERRRQEQLEAQAAPPTPEPEPAASCHPSYNPCLDPNASDYDCEGGSGDGPMYTGFVTVSGSDDYGLDSDGDGTGCES